MNKSIKINDNISWKILSAKVVAVNLDNGNYYTFNETASYIWQKLEKSNVVENIVKEMLNDYAINDEKQLTADVNEIIDFWINEKLVSTY